MTELPLSSSPIFLDSVQCDGSETSLLNCTSNRVDSYNCGTDSGAGVRCGGTVLYMHFHDNL